MSSSNISRFPRGCTTQPKTKAASGAALIGTDLVHLARSGDSATTFHFNVGSGVLAADSIAVTSSLNLGGAPLSALGTIQFQVQSVTHTSAADALSLSSFAGKDLIDITFTHTSGGTHDVTLPAIAAQGQQLVVHAKCPNTHQTAWAAASGNTLLGTLPTTTAGRNVVLVLLAVTETMWLPLHVTDYTT